MLKIICKRSKKNNRLYYALVNCSSEHEIFVTFDVVTIAKLFGLDLRDIYILQENEEIYYTYERS